MEDKELRQFWLISTQNLPAFDISKTNLINLKFHGRFFKFFVRCIEESPHQKTIDWNCNFKMHLNLTIGIAPWHNPKNLHATLRGFLFPETNNKSVQITWYTRLDVNDGKPCHWPCKTLSTNKNLGCYRYLWTRAWVISSFGEKLPPPSAFLMRGWPSSTVKHSVFSYSSSLIIRIETVALIQKE